MSSQDNAPNRISGFKMLVAMRERRLQVICEEGSQIFVKKASDTEASCGAALLAAALFE
jgi:hypothetical protein